mmetsp:Transcript_16347/g.41452  ORF Transcript_16347/g.41452 Transcript_16347/m.41452 type:complete len:222 (-) Transcript_16347:287-952(-)
MTSKGVKDLFWQEALLFWVGLPVARWQYPASPQVIGVALPVEIGLFFHLLYDLPLLLAVILLLFKLFYLLLLLFCCLWHNGQCCLVLFLNFFCIFHHHFKSFPLVSARSVQIHSPYSTSAHCFPPLWCTRTCVHIVRVHLLIEVHFVHRVAVHLPSLVILIPWCYSITHIVGVRRTLYWLPHVLYTRIVEDQALCVINLIHLLPLLPLQVNQRGGVDADKR